VGACLPSRKKATHRQAGSVDLQKKSKAIALQLQILDEAK